MKANSSRPQRRQRADAVTRWGASLGEDQLTDAELAPLLRSRWVQPMQVLRLDQNQLTRTTVSWLAVLRGLDISISVAMNSDCSVCVR